MSTKLTDAFADALDMQGRVKNPKRFDMPQPQIETVLVDSAYRDAAISMRALYRDRGYLDAQVELKPIELKNREAKVTFAVTEGRQVPFGEVKYEGVPDGFPLKERAWQPKGDPFSTRSLERIRQSTVTELSRRGYTYAKVDGEWVLDDRGQAGVTFTMVPGPQVHVGKIFVRGLYRTDEAVVRGQLVLTEGNTLSPDDLLDSQRNLIALGIFATAEVRLVSPETAEPVKDVLVELHEGKRLTGSWGLGYFLAEGPRAFVDGTYPNAFGEAVALQAHLQLNYFGASALAVTRAVDVSNLNQFTVFGGRANISLIKRGFLYPELGARADLIAERIFRPSYQFTRVAASVPGFDWSHSFRTGFERLARLKLTLLLQYQAEISNVLPVSSLTPQVDLTLPVADQQRLRFSFGTFALSTVRTGFTIDLRDDPCCRTGGRRAVGHGRADVEVLCGGSERRAGQRRVPEAAGPADGLRAVGLRGRARAAGPRWVHRAAVEPLGDSTGRALLRRRRDEPARVLGRRSAARRRSKGSARSGHRVQFPRVFVRLHPGRANAALGQPGAVARR